VRTSGVVEQARAYEKAVVLYGRPERDFVRRFGDLTPDAALARLRPFTLRTRRASPETRPSRRSGRSTTSRGSPERPSGDDPDPRLAICDNCGRAVERPYRLQRFQGRLPNVCADCLQKIARGVAQAHLAVSRWST
jgi:hypothetical protein